MTGPSASGGPEPVDPQDGVDGVLACGASSEDLLAQVADGGDRRRTAHQQQCPHCQATLAEYARLWAPVTELAGTEVRAPAGLFDSAMATVRAAAGPPGWGRVDDQAGPYLVAARAVVSVAGYAARTTTGVRMALGALERLGDVLDPGHDGHVEAGVTGRSVALDLTVAAEYGQDLRRLADRLRDRVTREVRAVTGLEAVEVSVTIDDVFPRLDAL